MLEVVDFSVRPKNQDKKLHVFRFLFDSEKVEFSRVKAVFASKMNALFPFGYYVNKMNRHLIDYIVFDSSYIRELVENCEHEYLTRYLNSDDDEGS